MSRSDYQTRRIIKWRHRAAIIWLGVRQGEGHFDIANKVNCSPSNVSVIISRRRKHICQVLAKAFNRKADEIQLRLRPRNELKGVCPECGAPARFMGERGDLKRTAHGWVEVQIRERHCLCKPCQIKRDTHTCMDCGAVFVSNGSKIRCLPCRAKRSPNGRYAPTAEHLYGSGKDWEESRVQALGDMLREAPDPLNNTAKHRTGAPSQGH